MKKLLTWTLEKKVLPLRYNWKISRNESTSKTNFFVHVFDGENSGIGEAAPNIRYGETTESITEGFRQFLAEGAETISSTEDLKEYPRPQNALSFAIESAFIHLKAKQQNISPYTWLNLGPPVPAATSYTIPIMDLGEVKDFIEQNNLNRFRSLKIKVNRENARDFTLEVAKHTEKEIRVDANEAFNDPDEVMNYLESVSKVRIGFLEQPFPATASDKASALKTISPLPVFADESITDNPDWESISKGFHGINMKLMKAGGYLNGIRILSEARKYGLKTMTGCMVETSLGISSALQLSSLSDLFDLDGCYIIQSDPYNLVSEKTGCLILS